MPELIVALILVFAIVIYLCVKNNRKETLRKQVDWVTSTNDGWDSPRDMQIWKYVYNAQIEKNIPQQYCITQSEDWDLVRSVIQECADRVGKNYLSRRIEPSAEYAALSCQEFFFAMLYYHLHIEVSKYNKICGKDMYAYTETFVNEFGRDAQRCFLSNAGIVYYKLCYIISTYCKDNPRINCVKTGVWITGDDKFYRTILDRNYVEQ